jgi:general L-amino acid transport system substrate-binding protein
MIKRLAVLFAVLALILAACGSGDDDTTTTAAADTGGAVQAAGETLAAVKARGTLKCGVSGSAVGFSETQPDGTATGFDADYCRALAAAVLGDADAVEFVALIAAQRFEALRNNEIDVLIRNTTWTATRDGQEAATFLFTTYFDGQGMMVPAASGVTTLEELQDANICVLSGTTTELNLTAVLGARGIAFTPVVFEDNTQLRPAYEAGQCDAWTSDASQIGSFKFTIESEGGPEQFIMPEIFSKEPLGPTVRDGDSAWAQAVEWSVMATVQAWEFGLDSGNIGSYSGSDPNILNFIGGMDPSLGLPTDFAVKIVQQVGNYSEIYNKFDELAPLSGSVNDLWSNGGLMYVPPYR